MIFVGDPGLMALMLVVSVLCHLIGDYVLQNHWMANQKRASWLAATVHALLYGLPFTLIAAPLPWAVIVGTHLLIDRLQLARYWVDFWGIGKEGTLLSTLMRLRGYERVQTPDQWQWQKTTHRQGVFREIDVVPITGDAPPFLAVWLLIIVDNTMHLTINFLSLMFL